MAQRVRRGLREVAAGRGATVSTGVASVAAPDQGKQLLRADSTVDEAKRSGRDRPGA